jgi:hypothetical protein
MYYGWGVDQFLFLTAIHLEKCVLSSLFRTKKLIMDKWVERENLYSCPLEQDASSRYSLKAFSAKCWIKGHVGDFSI